MNRLIIALLLIFFTANLSAQRTNIVGLWKTVDDKTGKVRSVVEIYEQNGQVYGKIKQLFREPHEIQDPVCKECTDHRKDKKVVGMEIISGLKKNGSEYSGGQILDPENGKTYDCKLWVEDGKLKVRGYIAFIYRTQTWLPHQ